MIGITAGTTDEDTIITPLRRSKNNFMHRIKRGAARLPFLSCRVSAKAR
jgi:hypothetical protein